MGLTTLAIRKFVPLPAIESFDKYLFIGPHPDDIEIGAGATAAKLVQAGKQVSFLICTDGRFGDAFSGGLQGEKLAQRRRHEALASAAVLGVTDVRFLNLRDGAGYKKKDLLRKMAEVIIDVQPDIIFAPDPDVKTEAHPDHLAVGRAAKTLACMAPYGGIMQKLLKTEQPVSAPMEAIGFYMTASPNRFVKTKGFLSQQQEAIFQCHTSQYPEGSADADSLKLYLKLRSIEFGLQHFCAAAEGFRVVGKTHMHCLPESENL